MSSRLGYRYDSAQNPCSRDIQVETILVSNTLFQRHRIHRFVRRFLSPCHSFTCSNRMDDSLFDYLEFLVGIGSPFEKVD